MADPTTTTPTTSTPAPSSTPSAAPSQGARPSQGGGGATPTTTERVYAGKYKTPDELEKAYSELENKFGQNGTELGRWRQYGEQASQWMDAWRPALEQLNYDPQALAQLLEQKAQAATNRGDHQGAQQIRDWAAAITPQDQQRWIESYVGDQYTAREKALLQQMGTAFQERDQYWNRFADYSLKVMQAIARNPDLDPTALLQDALKRAQQAQADPISAAVQAALSPKQMQSWLKKHDDDQRKAWELEQANKQSTAGAIAGGPPPREAYRIPSLPTSNGQTAGPSPSSNRDQMAQVRERAIRRITELGSG